MIEPVHTVYTHDATLLNIALLRQLATEPAADDALVELTRMPPLLLAERREGRYSAAAAVSA